MSGPILELRSVCKLFRIPGIGNAGKSVHAMEDVSFSIGRGRSLALVGESGSGKTTTAAVICGMYERTSGEIWFDGRPAKPSGRRAESLAYKKRVQMVFQDPFASLNPTHTIRAILERPFLIHGLVKTRRELESKLEEILELVGLTPPQDFLRRFPHELSGGQRQRVNIARTFAVEPELVLADEPTSMLDVSIRLGIMNMMLDLKERNQVSYLYITHDLAGARYMSTDIAVMYAGMIMETGPTEEVITKTLHPYVALLRASAPDPGVVQGAVRGESRIAASDASSGVATGATAVDASAGGRKKGGLAKVEGEIPSLVDLPPGCRFAGRCPHVAPVCRSSMPELRDLGGGHLVRCHFA